MRLRQPKLTYTPASHEIVVIKKVTLKRHLGGAARGTIDWWSVLTQAVGAAGVTATGMAIKASPIPALKAEDYRLIIVGFGSLMALWAVAQIPRAIFGAYGTVNKALSRICEEQEGALMPEPVPPKP